MAGLVPAISLKAARPCTAKRDGRDKPGHVVMTRNLGQRDRIAIAHGAVAGSSGDARRGRHIRPFGALVRAAEGPVGDATPAAHQHKIWTVLHGGDDGA
jgi:hypothetical protein